MAMREERVSADAAPRGRDGRAGSGRNGLGAGAPLTASFIGLLMLGSIRPAEAEEAGEDAVKAPGKDDAGIPIDGATPVLNGPLAATLIAAPQIAAGSVLTVGDYLEPMTVAQLSGNYSLAEPPAEPFAGRAGDAAREAANVSNNVEADVSVALGATAAAAATEVVEEPVDDENLEAPGRSLDGTEGNDTLVGTDLADRMLGGDGDDLIEARGGDDVAFGGAGADRLLGGAGNDEISGGAGNDRLDGGDGDDLLFGDAGNDEILGGAGNDRLVGGAGDDRLVGGTGADRLEGGPGDDTMVIESISDVAIETGEGPDGGGNDTLEVADVYAENARRDLAAFAPEGEATFSIDDDLSRPLPDEMNQFRHQIDPDIENVTLFGDADHDIIGDEDDNTLIGNDGDNQLFGGLGDDALWGGDGEDLLYGGDGDDILFGGEGDDIYLLGLAESGSNTVFDHQGSNLLRIDGADPAKLSARLDGNTLVFEHDGAEVVRIDDYTSKPDSFEGVEIDGKVTSIQDFLPTPPAVPVRPQSDLLGEYLDQPNDEPPSAASGDEFDLPAEAVIESETETMAATAAPIDLPKGQVDLLEAFMIDQEIWTSGDEQSLYSIGDQAGVEEMAAAAEKDVRT